MKFEILNPKKHNRSDFDCGVDILNFYLKKVANQNQKRILSRVYVLSDNTTIIGCYSISAHSVSRDNLPKDVKLGNYNNIPFLLLGRLAVDRRHQGKGYGEAMVFHACKTTVATAEQIGIFGMVVDAKDKKAVGFYEGLGFRALSRTKSRLVLPVTVITKK